MSRKTDSPSVAIVRRELDAVQHRRLYWWRRWRNLYAQTAAYNRDNTDLSPDEREVMEHAYKRMYAAESQATVLRRIIRRLNQQGA